MSRNNDTTSIKIMAYDCQGEFAADSGGSVEFLVPADWDNMKVELALDHIAERLMDIQHELRQL